MSVYGTYGAFQGLGKPSIKLEFEDNEALLAFQRKMQDGDDGNNDPDDDGGNFTRGEKVLDSLSRMATGRPYLKAVTNEEPVDGIGTPGDLYLVRDMRSNRARKEPGELAANKNLQFTKDERRTLQNFDKDLYLAPQASPYTFSKEVKGKKYKYCFINISYRGIDNTREEYYYLNVHFYSPRKKNGKNIFKGYETSAPVEVKLSDFVNLERNGRQYEGYALDSQYKKWFNEALKNQIAAYQKTIRSGNSLAAECAKYLKYLVEYYSNIDKYTAYVMYNYGDPALLNPATVEEYKRYIDTSIFDGVNAEGLGAPGDTYIITDTRTRARKDLEDTAALKKYDIRKFSGKELQRMQTDDPLLYEQIKSDLGRTANDALYNNLEILDFRGMQPTYRILSDYSQFFAPADNKSDFAGFGLDDTKQLIADTCRRYYKECEAIAKHLKADTVLQSCFNLWHWLHNNIRYEYDAAGKEEIRTPRRVWADRHRGVDCDCLSTFAWCVLKCMGYNPVFELAAFKNKPAFSHIYVVCDGVVVDRVWFVFNSRPPGITKREIFVVKNLQNLGQLF